MTGVTDCQCSKAKTMAKDFSFQGALRINILIVSHNLLIYQLSDLSINLHSPSNNTSLITWARFSHMHVCVCSGCVCESACVRACVRACETERLMGRRKQIMWVNLLFTAILFTTLDLIYFQYKCLELIWGEMLIGKHSLTLLQIDW